MNDMYGLRLQGYRQFLIIPPLQDGGTLAESLRSLCAAWTSLDEVGRGWVCIMFVIMGIVLGICTLMILWIIAMVYVWNLVMDHASSSGIIVIANGQ
jgi:hypothetical protein